MTVLCQHPSRIYQEKLYFHPSLRIDFYAKTFHSYSSFFLFSVYGYGMSCMWVDYRSHHHHQQYDEFSSFIFSQFSRVYFLVFLSGCDNWVNVGVLWEILLKISENFIKNLEKISEYFRRKFQQNYNMWLGKISVYFTQIKSAKIYLKNNRKKFGKDLWKF